MIAIKEKDAVYFASPMKFHNFLNQARVDFAFEENGNVWHVGDEGRIVMASTDNWRLLDVMRYSDTFYSELSEEGMNGAVAKLKKAIKGTNCFMNGDNLGATFFVAQGNKGYKVSAFGAIFEIDDIECTGERDEPVLAAYEYCRDIPDVYKRIEELYNRISDFSDLQYFPIAVVSTKDNSYTLITKDKS